jgi:hypothetical protein
MPMKSVRMRLAGGVAFLAALTLGGAAFAGDDSAPPSQSATINLIRLLVKEHVISQRAADALLKEAEAEAAQARASATAATQINASQQPAAQGPAATAQAATPLPPAPGVVRVPYVPEIVKNQIRNEVRDEVLAQAKAENWAQPNALPAWVKRFQLFGDLRFRDEFDFYSQNNASGIVDYATFNSSGPTQSNPSLVPFNIPFLNTTTNRLDMLSVRARLGVAAQVTDNVFVGIRLATGSTTSPVSTTQMLGGGLTKDNIWLDQVYVDVQPVKLLGFTLGRMPDPFDHTNLLFDENLNFDGVDAHFDTKSSGKRTIGFFGVLGFFPLEYASNTFPTFSPTKSPDSTKFLAAAQAGADWQSQDFTWRSSLAYYDFDNVRGELSSPCNLDDGATQCSSDQSRPAFMQKGNTLFLIRDIISDLPPKGFPLPEYAGLSFNYDELDFNSTFTTKLGSKYDLQLQGDYVRNLAYDPKSAYRYAPLGTPFTNVGAQVGNAPPPLESGPNGYQGQATFGDLVLYDRWQWNVFAGYRYLEPDAVLDAFTWSDFHLGGTNAKGYFVGASLAVYDNTWITARWLSADQIYGPPLAIDVLQVDLNTAF